MKNINEGGPAFPFTGQRYERDQDGQFKIKPQGMSLRDYFAAAALQGLLACPTLTSHPETPTEHMSEWSFKYADAMIAAKEAK